MDNKVIKFYLKNGNLIKSISRKILALIVVSRLISIVYFKMNIDSLFFKTTDIVFIFILIQLVFIVVFQKKYLKDIQEQAKDGIFKVLRDNNYQNGDFQKINISKVLSNPFFKTPPDMLNYFNYITTTIDDYIINSFYIFYKDKLGRKNDVKSYFVGEYIFINIKETYYQDILFYQVDKNKDPLNQINSNIIELNVNGINKYTIKPFYLKDNKKITSTKDHDVYVYSNQQYFDNNLVDKYLYINEYLSSNFPVYSLYIQKEGIINIALNNGNDVKLDVDKQEAKKQIVDSVLTRIKILNSLADLVIKKSST